ncbi:TAF10 RNA polymerase II, TATA box Hypothetical protein protein (TBP)-associated factor [Nesidiocoris tenuis]|uniref:Transcription initiation factor TFIID subunit 10 n=1 Tax=Nesidiocoris tenuis TaxID=355587 RepID=A0ABN7B4A3_9HEMI|nr:TAF10 RNA polymerase II, TATA box Hypothetical protein protein (TBP)-associated factor [Nesidiocoris tenuis]
MPAEISRKKKEEESDLSNLSCRASGDLARLIPKIENYTSTIPDAVLLNLMTTAGIASTDPTTTRLISLAAQKFLSGVAYDALQHCKVRTSNQSSKSHHGQSANHNGSNHSSNHRQERRTLTMDDLTPALAERGIAIRKPPYYE